MTKIIITAIFALGAILPSAAQEVEKFAKVTVIEGKESFILNRPLRDYNIVGEIRTGPKWTSILTRGIINEHINDKSAQYVRKATRKQKRQGDEFDALVYDEEKKIKAIRFTEQGTPATMGIAKIIPSDGVYTYIMAEPLESYKVMETIGNGINVLPFLTYGFFNNSIKKMSINL